MTFLNPREIAQPGDVIPPVDEELFAAAKNNNPAKLRERLAAGIPADHPYGDLERMTPLIYAIQAGNHECMRILLEAGADVQLIDSKFGHSPLRAAIHKNDRKAVEILLEFDADPAFKSVGKLPDGTRHGCVSDEDLARQLCTPEIAEMVTAARAKFRITEMTHDNINAPEALKELLDQGLSVDIKNHNGQTALHYACLHRNYETAKILLEAGADTEIEWHRKGNTALRMACYAGLNRQSDPELVKLLLAHGANINSIDDRGRNMAHAAASTADPELLKLMVANGVSLTAKDAEGKTPAEASTEWSDKVDAAPVIAKIIEIEEIGRSVTQLDNPVRPMAKIRFGKPAKAP